MRPLATLGRRSLHLLYSLQCDLRVHTWLPMRHHVLLDKKIQAEMETKNTDVKFILEARVGSLMALTAEGDLLLAHQHSKSLKNKKRAVARPIDSFSKVH